jgi:TolB-like protein
MRNIRMMLYLVLTIAGVVSFSGCAASHLSSSRDMPSPPSKGKTFTAVRDVVDYFDSHGYVIQGRFEQSQWPATVVFEKESLNEISFALKSGIPHLYSGYDGYRLRVVALEDAAHGETVLVFRSKKRTGPERAAAPVNRPVLPPGKELDRQLDILTIQINSYLAAQKAPTVAVVEFSNLDGSISDMGKYLAEELTTRLVRSKKIQVVERKLLNRTLEEQKLSASGMIDQKTAKAFGSLFGADAILTGTVSLLDTNVRINARLIATETGAVFAAASATIPRGKEVDSLMGNAQQPGTVRADNFVIAANAAWQNVIPVKAGQSVTIKAEGTWNHGEASFGAYGPEGSGKMDNGVPLPTESVGTLIGRINNGPPFAVGAGRTFTPTASGVLQLSMNDWGFDNDTGSVSVSIIVK